MNNLVKPIKHLLIGILLFIIWVFPSVALAETQTSQLVAESQWWQLEKRDYSFYTEWGPQGHLLMNECGPAFITGLLGGTFSLGYWFHPLLAFEVKGDIGVGDSQTWSGDINSEFVDWTLGGGLRFALPIKVTPVVAVHLLYGHQESEWVDLESYSGWAKTSERDSLILNASAGLTYGIKAITLGFFLNTDFNLVSSHSGTQAVDSDGPGFLGPLKMGFEFRLGIRF